MICNKRGMDLASPRATPSAARRKAGVRRAICILLWSGPSSPRPRRRVADDLPQPLSRKTLLGRDVGLTGAVLQASEDALQA